MDLKTVPAFTKYDMFLMLAITYIIAICDDSDIKIVVSNRNAWIILLYLTGPSIDKRKDECVCEDFPQGDQCCQGRIIMVEWLASVQLDKISHLSRSGLLNDFFNSYGRTKFIELN